MMCESDRGEWGKPCPDCGQQLPPFVKAIDMPQPGRVRITHSELSRRRDARQCAWIYGCDKPAAVRVSNRGRYPTRCEEHAQFRVRGASHA